MRTTPQTTQNTRYRTRTSTSPSAEGEGRPPQAVRVAASSGVKAVLHDGSHIGSTSPAVRLALALVTVALLSACDTGSDPTGDGGAGVPVGEAVQVARWGVRVVGARDGGSPDADAPRARVDVKLTASYLGEGTSTFADDIAASAYGVSGAAYDPSSISCSDALAVARPTDSDGMVEGFVCFSVEMADSAGLQLLLTPIRGGAPVTMNTIVQPEADDFGPDELVDQLIGGGFDAHVVSSPYDRSPFLPRARSELVLCLNGQESQLHEYATAVLRQADSNQILPSGQFVNGIVDLSYGRLMWWAKGRVIVNYNFADPDVWDALAAVLGETVSPEAGTFGAPPDPLPTSDLCS